MDRVRTTDKTGIDAWLFLKGQPGASGVAHNTKQDMNIKSRDFAFLLNILGRKKISLDLLNALNLSKNLYRIMVSVLDRVSDII